MFFEQCCFIVAESGLRRAGASQDSCSLHCASQGTAPRGTVGSNPTDETSLLREFNRELWARIPPSLLVLVE